MTETAATLRPALNSCARKPGFSHLGAAAPCPVAAAAALASMAALADTTTHYTVLIQDRPSGSQVTTGRVITSATLSDNRSMLRAASACTMSRSEMIPSTLWPSLLTTRAPMLPEISWFTAAPTVASGSMQGSGVADCVRALIEGWRFPKPVGGSVEVTFPFVFQSHD